MKKVTDELRATEPLAHVVQYMAQARRAQQVREPKRREAECGPPPLPPADFDKLR